LTAFPAGEGFQGQPAWEASPQGISAGGYGLSIRTEDIAKFGQLYLQKGKWQGQQLVAASWVEEATARQTANGSNPTSDWDQGYGYQFWRCRHGAYRGDGAFGQYCVVLPEQESTPKKRAPGGHDRLEAFYPIGVTPHGANGGRAVSGREGKALSGKRCHRKAVSYLFLRKQT
jgi:hypothetical protein